MGRSSNLQFFFIVANAAPVEILSTSEEKVFRDNILTEVDLSECTILHSLTPSFLSDLEFFLFRN